MDSKDMGRLGGKARAERLTAEELSAIGRKGAAGRWKKRRRYVAKKTKKAKVAV